MNYLKMEKIKQNEFKIKNKIKLDAESYPYLLQFCEINIKKNINIDKEDISFGHFNTKEYYSYPFYKPFSKIIDFSKIDE